ncbi:MAG: energy-coupling factor ABC transporter ATP-binding protein [Anaerolineales bacterium]
MSVRPIVEVRDLWYSYPQESAPADFDWRSARNKERPHAEWVLRGIDFQIEPGEFMCLMGASGAGKSTLALALNGSVPQSTGGRIRGQVLVDGLDTKRVPVAELARLVGVGFQDPETQFLGATVERELAFGLENLGVPPNEISRRVDWALELIGMTGCRNRSPAELSGGEKQRVGIAALLAMASPILVLDEPTASLDPEGATEVFDIIKHLKGNHTVIMVTQDGERAAECADRILVIDGGQVAIAGPPEGVFRQVDALRALGVRPPQVSELAHCLNLRGNGSRFRFTRLEEAARAIEAEQVS